MNFPGKQKLHFLAHLNIFSLCKELTAVYKPPQVSLHAHMFTAHEQTSMSKHPWSLAALSTFFPPRANCLAFFFFFCAGPWQCLFCSLHWLCPLLSLLCFSSQQSWTPNRAEARCHLLLSHLLLSAPAPTPALEAVTELSPGHVSPACPASCTLV